jgi:hypothetical protein
MCDKCDAIIPPGNERYSITLEKKFDTGKIKFSTDAKKVDLCPKCYGKAILYILKHGNKIGDQDDKQRHI